MRHSFTHIVLLAATGLLAARPLSAANFTTTTVQTAGNNPNWNSAVWNPGSTAPVAGNSYEAQSGALLRSPYSANPQPFNGDSLQLDSGAAIRLKAYTVTNTYTFGVNGIILNGGWIGNGDDQRAIIASSLSVLANSSIFAGPDATSVNVPTGALQGFRTCSFNGSLSGSGSLTFGNAVMYNNPQVTANVGVTPNFVFNGSGAAYSGAVSVTAGWLQAGSANAFQGDITVAGGTSTNGIDGPAQFSASVAFSTPGNLVVQDANSTLLLSNALAFGQAMIDGVSLSAGVYTAAQINALTSHNNVIGPQTLTVGAGAQPPPNLTWVGSVNGNWNLTTANWNCTGGPTNYSDGSNVTFDDTASRFQVQLATNVSPGAITVSNNLQTYVLGGSGGIMGNTAVTKLGIGMLSLNQTNAYGGVTTLVGGNMLVNGKNTGAGAIAVNTNTVFGGTGSVAGSVTVQSGGTLAPGAGSLAPGATLGIGNVLSLSAGSFTIMKVKTGGVCDQAVVGGTMACGGTLIITNAGGALVGGDVFKLFTVAGYSGNFASLNLPTLATRLLWRNTLASNGTLSVVAITPPTVADLAPSSVMGTRATLNAQVVSTGNETPTVTLLYGPVDGGTNLLKWSNRVALGLQSGFFSFTATALVTNTTYYYTIVASNSAGVAWAQPASVFTTAPADPPNIPTTQIQYLSGTDKDHTVPWQFYMTGGGRSNNVQSTIPVPSCWQTKGYGSYSYGNHTGDGTVSVASSTGYYSTMFSVPASWAGERIFLVYEGVLTDTSTLINGQPVGPLHQGGFFEFSYEVTPYVVVGATTNELNVTVNEWSANTSINQAEREGDYWNFSGIFRPVYLKAVPQAYIDRIAVDAQASGQITVNSYLGGITQNYSLNAFVTDTNNNLLGVPFTNAVPAGATNAILSAALPTPNDWSAEFPTLYTLTVQLIDTNGMVIHSITNQIGFRTITFVNQRGYLINGQKVVLRGVNRHEFWPTDGRTTSRAESDMDINLMKDMNFNAVRLSHYPPNKMFLEECDRLGLYVYDELPGWQQAYDNTVAPELVRETVVRDVNHPCIIAWDNGNEGGWNTTVDNDSATSTNYYRVWDPQNRHVNRPGSYFNNVQDDHYPGYFSGSVGPGKTAYSATEILHGNFDGGGGASLPDYWDLMRTATNGVGMFLWAFLDEGLVRDDLAGTPIDVQDQNAPDGIVGPYRQPEASYYSYKSVYNPVQVTAPAPATFNGTLPVENRSDFTGLNQCTFEWQLGWLPDANDSVQTLSANALTGGMLVVLDSGPFAGPNVSPGTSGTLALPGFPANGTNYDALRLAATDPYGRNLYTWTWPLHSPAQIRDRILNTPSPGWPAITAGTNSTELVLTNGPRIFHFDKALGIITSLTVFNQSVSLANGPRPVAGPAWTVTGITNYSDGTNYYIAVNSLTSATNAFLWTLRPDGWLKLDYQYWMTGAQSWMGITFDYHSNYVTGMDWLGQGPYRVYKNRLTGQEVFGHTKATNYTSTGRSILEQPTTTPWIYPEFAGYHGQLYWATLQTTEQPITIVSTTTNLFLRVLTPPASGNANADTTYPPGTISLLHGISPMGEKFHPASTYGPSAALNTATGLYAGEVSFYFGSLPLLPAPPASLTATAGPGMVDLSWSAVPGAMGYNIKSATVNGGPYATITANVNSLAFTNTGLSNNATFYYVVTAVNANGESKSSPQAAATTPMLYPMSKYATVNGTNLYFGGINGVAGEGYLVLMTTNLFVPVPNWQVVGSNVFDANGRFNFTNSLSPSIPAQFFILRLK